ncbi:Pentatricopeptide repeat-containing protein [Apostasia shenzhenica]|uniref:Pentatricopeptide repeat-containing protein n=1 Tax=Apostasia shenzhenica TaxID=1088818 RepID=A0A2I0AYP4_9ASPA|nr:Pentatricopeptide repeat-containing protein [Apostasia shenzhenica]
MASTLLSSVLPPSNRPPHQQRSPNPSLFSHPSFLLLHFCSHPREIYQSLSSVIKLGMASEPIVQNKLIALFSRSGSIRDASVIFNSIPDKPEELYHCLLRGHAHHSSLEEALSFYNLMRLAGVRPLVHNLTYLLKSCSDCFDLRRGKEVHSQLILNGFGFNVHAMTAVVNMYAKCCRICDARKMFDRMPEWDLVTWNALVAGYAQNGLACDALEMVVRMQEDEQRPNSVTLISALPACADVGSLKIGKSIHGFAIKAGFESLVNVSTAVVDLYAKCGTIGLARLVFDGMMVKNVVSWNSMIVGYSSSSKPDEALKLYKLLLEEGIMPTDVTMIGALQACSELEDLEEGMKAHKLLLRIGLGSDTSVMNALITMYSKCKRTDLAFEVFKSLQSKSQISWNAMILGYAQNNKPTDALNLFLNMLQNNTRPDSFTMVSVIPALADISLPRQAKWIHGYAIRLHLDLNVFVGTALIDLYAKCGSINSAQSLFDRMEERHVTTWNSMIDAYGSHGFGKKAVELFEEMKRSPVKPSDVTFLNITSACSHTGLVEEGKGYFRSMKKDYDLDPGVDHYAAIVDLLGRAGKIEEAWSFIEQMPIKPSISVYGAMLGACKIHKNVKTGEAAAKRLFELEPTEGGYHVLLANIYASASLWQDVARVRKMMEKQGLQKTPGYSFIESFTDRAEMNLESEDGSLIPIEIGRPLVIGRDLGLGLGSSSSDRTISRRHVSLRIDGAVDGELDQIDRDGQIALKFQVVGKNPILVCSKGGGGKRVYMSLAEGELKAGDSFSPSIKNPVFFIVKREEGGGGVEKSVLDAVERRERKTQQRRLEAEERAKSEAAGLADSELDFGPLEISEIDPVKEFGFLVKGHEFDRYHQCKIRPLKDWNWFLEEPAVNGDDEEPKQQKMKKGVEEDEEWTGDSDDDKMVDKKVKFEQNNVDDEDETLGGFIVCDDDIEEENFDVESEEEELDEDDDED